jgi:sulfite dehydrogenase (cytochrome) subunit B
VKKVWLVLAAMSLIWGGVALAADPAQPQGTVTIVLPSDAGSSFRAGPDVEVAKRYCLTCHSSAYVATQPRLTTAQWTAEVKKMKNAYGAAIPDDQVATLVRYLVNEYGLSAVSR